jgi:Anaphase promoting complex subunit 8 / Cdc23
MMKQHASPLLSPMTPLSSSSSSKQQHQAQSSLDMDMAWNPAQACIDLQTACQILSDRGLKLAAKWAAEQWMGLPPEIIEGCAASGAVTTIPESLNVNSYSNNNNIGSDIGRGGGIAAAIGNPQLCYARCLLDLGEYSFAAATLSATSLTNRAASVEAMPPPQAGLDPHQVYVRAYALYMAGERAKEETVLELERYRCVVCVALVVIVWWGS